MRGEVDVLIAHNETMDLIIPYDDWVGERGAARGQGQASLFEPEIGEIVRNGGRPGGFRGKDRQFLVDGLDVAARPGSALRIGRNVAPGLIKVEPGVMVE